MPPAWVLAKLAPQYRGQQARQCLSLFPGARQSECPEIQPGQARARSLGVSYGLSLLPDFFFFLIKPLTGVFSDGGVPVLSSRTFSIIAAELSPGCE